jgi:FlaA1/EpsC-like NDP-sugar epimerase
MTIPEAARLVFLAGAYATGGDVFVLDMGKPMRIIDIARRMIEMSGCNVDGVGPHTSNINIVITGLRPGEKLYEELLIDDASIQGTPHEKILRAHEDTLSELEVRAMIKEVTRTIEKNDVQALSAVITKFVDGYHRQEIDIPAE